MEKIRGTELRAQVGDGFSLGIKLINKPNNQRF